MKTAKIKKIIFLTMTLMFCSCSTYIPPKYDLTGYDKKYLSFDMEVYWKEGIKDGEIKIDGLVKNIYIYDIFRLEITARAFSGEKKVAEETYYFYPRELKRDEILPFTISLKGVSDKNVKIKFFYRYYANYDEDFSLQFGSF
ncbi:MAG: hypothetical protein N2999_02365 [Proteobacteria bacterium]|nr:hypothetical protein [Pseudomonadota bacterium]